MPTAATVLVPNVNKTEYEVADIDDDDFVSLIQPDGELKADLKLPAEEDLNKELRDMYENNKDKAQVFFTVQSAVGQEKIISGRFK